MKKIPLTKGRVALVDDEDFEELSKHKWCWGDRGGAQRKTHGGSVFVAMHRVIMNAPKGKVVDHINGDRSDNRRSNLRICTQAENVRNQSIKSNNKSGYKGVHWDAPRKKWHAHITKNNKTLFLGRFKEIKEAVQAYNEASIRYHGQFGKLNKV